MRKNILLFICIFLQTLVFAQTDKMPEAFTYQAVAHDAAGKILANQAIGIKIEILKNTSNGNCVFSETHSLTSNASGAITLFIGQGTTVTGKLSNIDWGADTYYLQLSMDIQGGTNYKMVSTTQMLPVPTALYAAKAGKAGNGSSSEGSNVLKYRILPSKGDVYGIYEIVTGKEIIKEAYADAHSLYLSFNIVYLDGKDQNIEAELVGLPVDAEEVESPIIGGSSIAGRYISWYYMVKLGSYDLKLVLKQNGQQIKEYPFKFTVKKREEK